MVKKITILLAIVFCSSSLFAAEFNTADTRTVSPFFDSDEYLSVSYAGQFASSYLKDNDTVFQNGFEVAGFAYPIHASLGFGYVSAFFFDEDITNFYIDLGLSYRYLISDFAQMQSLTAVSLNGVGDIDDTDSSFYLGVSERLNVNIMPFAVPYWSIQLSGTVRSLWLVDDSSSLLSQETVRDYRLESQFSIGFSYEFISRESSYRRHHTTINIYN